MGGRDERVAPSGLRRETRRLDEGSTTDRMSHEGKRRETGKRSGESIPDGTLRFVLDVRHPAHGQHLAVPTAGVHGSRGVPRVVLPRNRRAIVGHPMGNRSLPGRAFAYSEFVRAALAAGRTGNRIFAARIMWGTLDRLVDRLRTVHHAGPGGDLDLLKLAFGRTGFVHLHRRDVPAQAVSWHRAEQTGVWHRTGREEPEQPAREPRFDFDAIHKLARTIEAHNSGGGRGSAPSGSSRTWFTTRTSTPTRSA